MNFNNFTIKAQEALQKAIEIAQGKNQQMIEPIHILKAIMIVGDNVTSFLFNKLGVNSHNLEKVVDAEIESLPRVSGGDPMLGRETNAVFQKAAEDRKSTRLNSSHVRISYAVFCLKKK